MNYAQKLKAPRWQKKRIGILQRDNYTCQLCHSKDKTLHVHHIAYTGNDPWEIEDNLLITFCEDCHHYEQVMVKRRATLLINTLKSIGFMSNGLGHLAGVFMAAKDRNWREYQEVPCDYLFEAINDDAIWEQAEDKYWSRFNKTRLDGE
jgi:hypothetical protein